jgi:hypothetical protein
MHNEWNSEEVLISGVLTYSCVYVYTHTCIYALRVMQCLHYVKVICKVALVLLLTEHNAMKAYWGVEA